MRTISLLAVLLAPVSLLAACGEDSQEPQTPVGCLAGYETCGSNCVPAGTCQVNPDGCVVGYVACGGACVPQGTCQGATNTATNTAVNTATNTPITNTPANTATNTPVNTATNTPTNTETNTPTNVPVTNTATNTATNTQTNTVTNTPPLPTCGVRTGPCGESSTSTGSISEQYRYLRANVTGDKKTYMFGSNWWLTYSNQKIDMKGLSFTITGATPNVGGNAPAGFPTFYIGSYQNRPTECSNLPKQVSAIREIPTDFRSNATSVGDTSNFNAAYDVWFTTSSAPLAADQTNPGGGGVMLMVWMYKPSNRQPVGGLRDGGRSVSGVDGSWDVWVGGGAGGAQVVSYVSTTARSGLTFDLNKFIQDAVSRSYGGLSNNHYLSVVFGGFEIWGGPSGLSLQNFCVDVR